MVKKYTDQDRTAFVSDVLEYADDKADVKKEKLCDVAFGAELVSVLLGAVPFDVGLLVLPVPRFDADDPPQKAFVTDV